jgi:hypothetical protein
MDVGADEISAASQSLRSKGYIEVSSDGKIQAIPRVAGLIATCAFPEVSLVATYTNAQGAEDSRLFHLTGQIIVEDAALPTGKHRLTQLSSDILADRVVAQLHMNDQPAAPGPGEPCMIGSPVLQEAQEVARRSSVEAAAKVLGKEGIETRVAMLLAEALKLPISTSSLTITQWGESQGSPSLGVLETSHGLWRMRFVEEAKLELAPSTADEVIHEVNEMIASALSALS